MTVPPVVHAVILAGGQGTRFWPASRASRPKQLLSIVGVRTMLAETFERVRPLVPPERTWIVTAAAQETGVRAALPDVPKGHVVVEPVGRNTAAAIGLASALVERECSSAVTVVLPADHHVASAESFRETLGRAIDAAASGERLVTIGITPTSPETGYGWIERGDPISDGVFGVERFVEKPDRARAERLLATGTHLWNSGMFVWRVDAIRRALERHLPETARRLADATTRPNDAAALARSYAELADVSIDHGVLEKASDVAVVPAEFGWDDVGSWEAVARFWPRDEAGNAIRGRVVTLDASGNVVAADRRLVALVGVQDLVVVETDDALLVCPRDRAQDVKKVVEELRRRGWKETL